jgi:outer membrane protein assembly factor BamB
MAVTKKIECPSCGASSVFKLNEREYKCNYCQTTFVIKEPVSPKQPLVEVWTTAEANESKHKNSYNALILALVFFILIGISGVMFFLVKPQRKYIIHGGVELSAKWQKPSIQDAFIAVTKTSESIIVISKLQTNTLDSARISASVYNPSTKKIVIEKDLFYDNWQALTFGDVPNFNYLNGLIYCISKDSGLIAFDPLSLKQKVGSNFLPLKFKELESGISSISKEYNEPVYRLKNNLGVEYFYNVQTDKLYNYDAYWNQKAATIEQTKVFFTEHEHPFLVLATKNCDTLKPEFKIGIDDTSYIDKLNRPQNRVYGIKKARLVSNKVYCAPKFLSRFQNGIVLAFKDDLSKKTEVKVAYINSNGKTDWETTELSEFFKSADGTANCFTFKNEDKLYVSIQSYPKKFFCLDPASGKVLWKLDLIALSNGND